MKALVLAAGLLLSKVALIPWQGAPYADKDVARSFKGANAIIVHTPDSASAALTKLAHMLLSSGYTIASINKELMFIDTGYRATQSKGVQVALHFVVLNETSGAAIDSRGVVKIPGLGATIGAGDAPIEKRGMNGIAYMLAWQELEKVALSYPGGKAGYLKKP